MIVNDGHHRYASLADHEAGRSMSPREMVEDVIRRQTDGSLTFRIEEDQYTVAAWFTLDGRQYVHGWSKAALAIDPAAADHGLRKLFGERQWLTSPYRKASATSRSWATRRTESSVSSSPGGPA